MVKHDLIYKAGAWRLSLADTKIFDSNRLMLAQIEKLKRDIENNDPSDKKAQQLVNDLLYYFAWKIKDESV